MSPSPYDPTPNLGLARPIDNSTNWGSDYREAMAKIDQAYGAMQAATGQLLLDYGTRTDASPIYLGKAAPGSAQGDPVWTVTRFNYASGADNAPLLGTDVRTAVAWTARDVGWSP